MIALFGMITVLAMGYSRASIVTDIPEHLNDALLDGASLIAAKAILTAAIMCATGLVLAMLKMIPAGLFIVLLTVLGGLTAIGWADISFMILACLITVAMFGRSMADWLLTETVGAK